MEIKWGDFPCENCHNFLSKSEADKIVRKTLLEVDKQAHSEIMDKAEVIVSGNCVVCGKQLNCGRLFVCKECESNK